MEQFLTAVRKAGFDEGPQISDPRNPASAPWLEHFAGWWEEIPAKRRAGAATCQESGAPPRGQDCPPGIGPACMFRLKPGDPITAVGRANQMVHRSCIDLPAAASVSRPNPEVAS